MAFTSSLSACSLWPRRWPRCPPQRSAPASTTCCWPSCSFTTAYVAGARPPRGPRWSPGSPARRCHSRGSYRSHQLLFTGALPGGRGHPGRRRGAAEAGPRAWAASAPPRAVRSGVHLPPLAGLLHLGVGLYLRTAAARVCLTRTEGQTGSTPAPLRTRAPIRLQFCPLRSFEERSLLRGGVVRIPPLGGVRGSAGSAVPAPVRSAP